MPWTRLRARWTGNSWVGAEDVWVEFTDQ